MKKESNFTMCVGEDKRWQQERKEKVKQKEVEVVTHDVNKKEGVLFQTKTKIVL